MSTTDAPSSGPAPVPPVTRGPAGGVGEKSDDVASRRPVYHPPNKTMKPKIGRNVLGCVLYALLVISAFAAIVMVAVAKSGIVAVPYLTRFYTGPKPTRVVEAGVEKPEEFLEAVRSAFTESGATIQSPHSMVYTEAEITAAVRGALVEAERRGEADTSQTQVVIRKDALELTGKFLVKGIMINAQIDIVPTVENKALKLTIVKAKFGDFPVAPAIAKMALDTAIGRDSSTWNLLIADHELESVHLEEGTLELMVS